MDFKEILTAGGSLPNSEPRSNSDAGGTELIVESSHITDLPGVGKKVEIRSKTPCVSVVVAFNSGNCPPIISIRVVNNCRPIKNGRSYTNIRVKAAGNTMVVHEKVGTETATADIKETKR